MKKQINLLEGEIFSTLIKLALPIMATSFIQMAYNLIDMLWIGRISSGAVAAVGAAGMFMWLSNGLATLAKMGGQVKVAHALGANEYANAREYTKHSLQLGIVFALVFGLVSLLFSDVMIGFFQLNSSQVIQDATAYLQITCGLVIFAFLNQIFTGILTSMGNSKISFIANSIGLVINIILDPLLIFGFGSVEGLGVFGAGLATVISQCVVTLIFCFAVYKDDVIFMHIRLFTRMKKEYVINIFKIGFPMAMQSMLFSSMSMIIARLIAGWGDDAIAVQKIGSQIESISWMSAEGFAAAVNSFMAQNFGAKNMQRVKKGYQSAIKVMLVWGLFSSFALIVFPELIFQIFLSDPKVVTMGVDYLRILGCSQLFMCIEITTNGAFAGLGKPMPASINSILLTALRIPLAVILSATFLGLNGVWWSITISSILKGIIIVLWFLWFVKKMHLFKQIEHKKPMESYIVNE